MDKIAKFLVGLVMLPFCYAVSNSLVWLISSIQPSSYSNVPRSTWGLLFGFLFWIFLFFSLPRPVRSYVFAHELTHALWGWLMGARIKTFKISKKGGSVTLSRSNFVIALAPYFFPLYTVLTIIAYYLLSIFLDLSLYEPFWLGLVGLTWGFHLTFTIVTLMQHQPDIQENGQLFSYTLIYLLNALGIGIWIVSVASPTLQEFTEHLGNDIQLTWSAIWFATIAGWDWVSDWLATDR